jgi:signal transduction histidine kinase/ActR/RegA family two-component response regulator
VPHAALNTICDHASLLGDEEVFVVPDLSQDWRFQDPLFLASKDSLHFYASAPIVLSEGGADVTKMVQAGRLTIMRKEPWHEFGEEEAELLMDIAKMCQEAIENEWLHAHAKSVQRMQRELAHMSYELDLAVDEDTNEDITKDKAKESTVGVLLCPPRMQRVVDLMREMMGASTVSAIDVTQYRLQGLRADAVYSSAASPRGSVHCGAYSSMPWLQRSSSQGSDASQTSSFRSLDESNGSDFHVTSPTGFDTTPSISDRSSYLLRDPHSRSLSSDLSMEDNLRYVVSPGSSPSIAVYSGDVDDCPTVSMPAQLQEIGLLLTRMHKDHKVTKPTLYRNYAATEIFDDDEDQRESDYDNPLESLMSPATRSYITIPVFANDRIQPLFMFIVSFINNKKIFAESERLFCYSSGVIVGAACLRQQARLADRTQLDFIRSVQHELRTPLHGILGITDFLRQSLLSNDMTDKLDLTEDGPLASLLESIRLSGVSLSTILDDVLDFGAVSGLRGREAATTQIEEVDLVREVEDGCLDELEYIAMHERQDQQLMVYRGYYAVPTLVIKVAPELQTRFRTDRAKVKKILSKFVANALRYSDEHEMVQVSVVPSQASHSRHGTNNKVDTNQWIDFIVEDTGMGMEEEFLNHSLLKPFSKADSFSQGVGLGVTIAASFISQLGGQLHIQSEVGKGTRVHFTLPFGRRPSLIQKPVSLVSIKPYQVKTASFLGFTLEGQMKILEMIQERLTQNGVRVVEADQSAELVILTETILTPRQDGGKSQVSSSKPEGTIPRPVGSNGRVLVVSRNALTSSNIAILEGLSMSLFRPPFGPSSLDKMDDFLREESPVVLRTVPQPTLETEDNMGKVKTLRSKAELDKEINISHGSEVQHFLTSSPPASRAILADSMKKNNQSIDDDATTVLRATKNQSVTPTPTPSADLPAKTQRGKPFRVLVVEDNPINMRLVTAVLRKGGFYFVEAKDGVEAVEQYKASQPSIVLLDISLPLQDGFEACSQMRAHEMGHVPKIIAITALSSTADKIKGLEICGMDDWRTKPLNFKTLRADLVFWEKEWQQVWSVVERAESVSPSSSPQSIDPS